MTLAGKIRSKPDAQARVLRRRPSPALRACVINQRRFGPVNGYFSDQSLIVLSSLPLASSFMSGLTATALMISA